MRVAQHLFFCDVDRIVERLHGSLSVTVSSTVGTMLVVLDKPGIQIAFRKKIYKSVEELQADLDAWLVKYNQHRPHSGRYCYGKTPMETFNDSLTMAKEKILDRQHDQTQLTVV